MVTVSSTERITRPYGEQCAKVACVSCQALHKELVETKDALLMERVESNRLRRLHADLSASDTIRSLGGQWPQPTSQSMMFDEGSDTTVVDVEIP